LYCIVLYCIVLYCIVLYCIVLYCIVLYCIVLYYIVLYCIVLCCIAPDIMFFLNPPYMASRGSQLSVPRLGPYRAKPGTATGLPAPTAWR
jgi:hypothetical protein